MPESPAAHPVCGRCADYLDTAAARDLVRMLAVGPTPADRLAWCNRHAVIVVSELPECPPAWRQRAPA